MTSLPAFIDAHRIAFAEINGLVDGLDADRLATQSLCPDWDVRACIGHVMGVEKALTGWTPDPENLFDFGVALESDSKGRADEPSTLSSPEDT